VRWPTTAIPDGDTLSAVLISGPEHGTLSFSSDGAFVYTPFAGYVGADSFSYVASDGALSDPATVKLLVTNDAAPSLSDDSCYHHQEDTLTRAAASGVLANDTDVDSATLTVASPDRSPAARQRGPESADGTVTTPRPPTTLVRTASPTVPATAQTDSVNTATVNPDRRRRSMTPPVAMSTIARPHVGRHLRS
jgi:hypothetical protein